MIEVDVVVIGCGWAGILATYELLKNNITVLCIEKSQRPGGLLRSEITQGFTIDIGGSHIIFSKDAHTLSTMIGLLEGNVVKNVRQSFVKIKNLLVPYPLETGLYVLPPEERFEALRSFLETFIVSRDGRSEPKTLLEWMYQTFGSWISKNYLEPYNKKLWKRPLNRIDVDWILIPGRLPLPQWEDIIKAAVGMPSVGYKEQALFYYPARGGIEALFAAVYRKVVSSGARILLGEPLKSLKTTTDGVIVNNNVKAKRVINTAPIPELINVLEGDHDLTAYSKYFDHNKVIVIAVAVDKPAPPYHWIYVPDENVIFHRYAWVSNYSPSNAPQGKSLALLEITIPKGDDVPANIISSALRGFLKLTDLDEKNIMFTKMYINEYGYPIHTLHLNNIRDYILGQLKDKKIISVGRWGSWRYWNMDIVYKNVRDTISGMLEKGQYKGQ